MSDVTGSLLDLAPVVPVVVLDDPAAAVPLARALLAGGIGVVELTLRTPTAPESMRRIAAEVPEVRLGAGTVLTPADVQLARDCGATFVVSPGCTPALLEVTGELDMPFLPGVSTVSEALLAADTGLRELKFFPAEPAGGAAFLGSLASPLPHLRFCPTGGVTPASAPDYLALPNVGCVGGSWLTPASLVAAGDWDGISRLAAEAAALAR